MAAASNGRSEVVALLTKKGANIQAQDDVRGNTLSYRQTDSQTCIHFIIFIPGIVF